MSCFFGEHDTSIHLSAWKGYSPKLNYRFTAFSEVVRRESFEYHSSEGCAWCRCLLAWRRGRTLGGADDPALYVKEGG